MSGQSRGGAELAVGQVIFVWLITSCSGATAGSGEDPVVECASKTYITQESYASMSLCSTMSPVCAKEISMKPCSRHAAACGISALRFRLGSAGWSGGIHGKGKGQPPEDESHAGVAPDFVARPCSPVPPRPCTCRLRMTRRRHKLSVPVEYQSGCGLKNFTTKQS